MIVYGGLTFFMLGLIFGSFLNVCIYRLPRGESIIWSWSHCPNCQTKIKPWDNIPLLGFLLLRGRCRQCKEKISWRYPIVEFITGMAFCGFYLKFGVTKEIIILLVLTMFLILITFIDIEHQLILNKITIPGVAIGTVLSWQLGDMSIIQVLLGLLTGGVLLIGVALIGKGLFGQESMGMGDVKMAAMIGVFLGAKGIALALFLGFISAGIFSFIGMAFKKMNRKSLIPFGPFIAAGTMIYLFWGDQLVKWYLNYSGLQ